MSSFMAGATETCSIVADDLLLSCRDNDGLWILKARLKAVEISRHFWVCSINFGILEEITWWLLDMVKFEWRPTIEVTRSPVRHLCNRV